MTVAQLVRSPADDQVEALELLRSHRQRATLARRTVLTVLIAADRADEHLTVESIAERIGATAPYVSTIYRTLSSLSDLGLVDHTPVDGAASLFRLHGHRDGADHDGHHEAHHHAHLRCLSCGRISDAPHSLLEPLRDTLVAEEFDLDISRTVLVGTCLDCRT